jgi:hypothetical protein
VDFNSVKKRRKEEETVKQQQQNNNSKPTVMLAPNIYKGRSKQKKTKQIPHGRS